MRQTIVRIGLLVLFGSMSACGGGGGGGGGSTNSSGGGGSSGGGSSPSVVGIAIDPSNPTVNHGTPLTLTAHVVRSDGSTQAISNPGAINWSSANRFVAEVSATGGIVTTKVRGQTTITATYQTFQASTVVTVVPVLSKVFIDADLSSIPPTPPGGGIAVGPPYVPPTQFEIPPEFDGQLYAIAEYNDGVREDVTENAVWHMTDTTIGTVSNSGGSKGATLALKAGVTKVSAAYNGVTGQADYKVLPIRLLGRAGIPFGPMNGLLPPMAAVDGQGKATAAWSFQLTGEVFTGGHDGNNWTDRVRLNAAQNPTDQAILTAVMANAAGARLIVWYGLNGLYASYAKAGESFGAVKTVLLTNVTNFDSADAAVVTTSGEAIILWTDGGHNAYISRFDPIADTWSAPTALGVAIPRGL